MAASPKIAMDGLSVWRRSERRSAVLRRTPALDGKRLMATYDYDTLRSEKLTSRHSLDGDD